MLKSVVGSDLNPIILDFNYFTIIFVTQDAECSSRLEVVLLMLSNLLDSPTFYHLRTFFDHKCQLKLQFLGGSFSIFFLFPASILGFWPIWFW